MGVWKRRLNILKACVKWCFPQPMRMRATPGCGFRCEEMGAFDAVLKSSSMVCVVLMFLIGGLFFSSPMVGPMLQKVIGEVFLPFGVKSCWFLVIVFCNKIVQALLMYGMVTEKLFEGRISFNRVFGFQILRHLSFFSGTFFLLAVNNPFDTSVEHHFGCYNFESKKILAPQLGFDLRTDCN